ncbi:MAG TPA: hypothetical protein VEK79_12250 [Thermoanaerobaculia bacterium]|nr:hypothetical protein [Thermoanaerobaculia bacterium]
MLTALVTLTAITAIVCIVMLAVLLNRPTDAPATFHNLDVWEAAIRETIAAELARCREEVRATSSELRHDVTAAVDSLGRTLANAYENAANADRDRLERLHVQVDTARQSLTAATRTGDDAVIAKLTELSRIHYDQLHALTAFVADSMNRVSQTFDTRLRSLQETLDALRNADRHQP